LALSGTASAAKPSPTPSPSPSASQKSSPRPDGDFDQQAVDLETQYNQICKNVKPSQFVAAAAGKLYSRATGKLSEISRALRDEENSIDTAPGSIVAANLQPQVNQARLVYDSQQKAYEYQVSLGPSDGMSKATYDKKVEALRTSLAAARSNYQNLQEQLNDAQNGKLTPEQAQSFKESHSKSRERVAHLVKVGTTIEGISSRTRDCQSRATNATSSDTGAAAVGAAAAPTTPSSAPKTQ
jgi:hypothetical protein